MIQEGELPDGRDCYFRMVNGEKLLWRTFTGIFIPRDKLDQNIESRDSLYCLVLDCDEKEIEKLSLFRKIRYEYLRASNLNKPATDVEKKKYKTSLHRLRGEVYDFIACYGKDYKVGFGFTEMATVQGLYSIKNTRVKSKDGLPLIGWIVILHDVIVDDGAKYAWGCDGVWMSLITFNECAGNGDRIIDLEGFSSRKITEIFNYIEYSMWPDISGLDEKQVEKTESIFRHDLPFLTTVDYYGHVILPIYPVADDFLFIEKHALENGNKGIAKLAHEVYDFLVTARERFDYPHCLFVRFDGN